MEWVVEIEKVVALLHRGASDDRTNRATTGRFPLASPLSTWHLALGT
jgi:hypothetical protein